MQWNTKSNCGSQHYNRKLFITQKSLLMSICLKLKHKLCIQKNGYIYVLQVTLAIYKIHKGDLSINYAYKRMATSTCYKSHLPYTEYTKGTIRVRHSYDSSDVLSRGTPHSVQRSPPPHHQYLHPKKLHLYGCGSSHIRIGESVSSPPQ
jgi:hypothetical protein